jgi:hypothetical protein
MVNGCQNEKTEACVDHESNSSHSFQDAASVQILDWADMKKMAQQGGHQGKLNKK